MIFLNPALFSVARDTVVIFSHVFSLMSDCLTHWTLHCTRSGMLSSSLQHACCMRLKLEEAGTVRGTMGRGTMGLPPTSILHNTGSQNKKLISSWATVTLAIFPRPREGGSALPGCSFIYLVEKGASDTIGSCPSDMPGMRGLSLRLRSRGKSLGSWGPCTLSPASGYWCTYFPLSCPLIAIGVPSAEPYGPDDCRGR